MPTTSGTDWQKEFGLDGRKPPSFFSNPTDIDEAGNAAGQAHVLRRAFEDLRLDGVLCSDSSPIIYFRLMQRLDSAEVSALHRTFWNQGVAPILVLITSDEVHVYSSLSQPTLPNAVPGNPGGFVQKMQRVAEQLQSFILSVESREYFREHRPAFDPEQRVDRNLLHNLEATRAVLGQVKVARLESDTLDALLCRLVFTCYLFDREVIDRKYLEQAGILDAEHLRDILGRDKRSDAKADLYKLFVQLGEDFNGDLFSDDLDAEAKQVRVEHLDVLNNFFRGTDPRTKQQSFWPYEFGIIPIETISAIYEHFLKVAGAEEKKAAGAFYTPRFLAELVLDRVIASAPTLLDKRFLDPACGSGIFLVGLFNRLAEEWGRANPKAVYDAKLKGLTTILQTNLYGIDKNRTACRIAAFSLYLAFLDQLSPPDIRRVLKKVKVLPRLVVDAKNTAGAIRCADFFTPAADLPEKVDFVVGNPPWATVKGKDAPSVKWCSGRDLPLPGKQLAAAFVWKSPEHLTEDGLAYLVLPHGLLFNHTESAIDFQKKLFPAHAVELILNLADYQRFLFEEAEAPALVIGYTKKKPADSAHQIDYWAPKTDWAVTQAEVITILPQDRGRLTVREVLDDLRGADAPLIWKERYWATSRDRRLLDRLKLFSRLRDVLGQRGKDKGKRWIIAEGFEPFGDNDRADSRKTLTLARTARVEAGTHSLDLFMIPGDCDTQESLELSLRRGISDTVIFKKPLVLVTEGFSKVAFANLNIAYRHGIRGIHGPSKDADLLAMLTFYLRSNLARYFLFHTSASWGVSRARVDIDDLMRLPFPFPEDADNPDRASEIIAEVGKIMTDAIKETAGEALGRDNIVKKAQVRAEELVDEYFDLNDIERMLIQDTNAVIIPSVRPTRTRIAVPTILPAKPANCQAYVALLCETLNQWASKDFQVEGRAITDGKLGVGMVVLEKVLRGRAASHLDSATKNILATLIRIQHVAGSNQGSLALVRDLKVFDKTLLYVTKPIGMRFWTRTAALNDADEIAGTLLMRRKEDV
ncbi:N-6 DNA methylase [Gemmata sp. G18]|uniref:site-specific DNA-methyltransferase (adenine-specific) n=1 Tax=Gemmata palustris TaxID=2822762 RepID=A0ABS5BNS7_9BACT|nr:N-6 DNA methylase [Gemmata palustris]MBP3955339.1 N-6 DNA methylase [Gemmata palustris]